MMEAQTPVLEARLELVQLSGSEIESGISLTMELGGGYHNEALPPDVQRRAGAAEAEKR